MLNIIGVGSLGKTYRHMNRYRQIVSILFKYGFDNIIDLLKIDRYLEKGLEMISGKRLIKFEKLTPQERVRLIFEELGPTFIKFGQILSTRPDLVPLHFIHELEKLQDNVPPFGFEDVKSILDSEFKSKKDNNDPLSHPFESVEKTPFASASIGQVHRAILKNGDQVAIKIQRPGISNLVKVDLEILHHLATLMERHMEDLSFLKPVKIVKEFAATLEKELDYTLEASNMQRVTKQFLFNPTIYIPKVYPEYTTSTVLTMEYIQGIKISDINLLDARGYDRKLLTRRGADFILIQVLEHGFFHGDLHPGNIFVLPENVLCPVDFGIMGYVDHYSREVFVDLIAATVMQNTANVSRLLLELTDYDEEPDMRELEKDIAGFTGLYLTDTAIKDIRLGKMLHDIVQIAMNHRLRLYPETFLMLKAFAAVEGVAHIVDPEFDMVRHAAPYIRKAKTARFSPSRLSDDVSRVSVESIKLFQNIPKEALAIIRQLRKGQLVLSLDSPRFDKLISSHQQASNKMALSIIIASLIIGAAMLLSFKVPPLIFGISVIGLSGFIFAGVVGFMLVISILKNG
ncbi:UbiB [Desulfamplus magnetovallimortis]|uniref:UbiB n=1 Tax=Desulfamplus magnetovallimortis TaxID=1246637 RepID=A0A1W1HCT3_9BACT|nr:AarF/UbiB family protein [Desulfamplus magnetovallimortis]SLM30198.1 UbiB [Desulfamplus magnetovallimortis]